MKPLNFAVWLTLFCSLIIGAFWITTAGAVLGGSVPDQMRVSALTEPFQPTASQRRELRKLRGQIRAANSASIASTASIPDARPVELPGELADAWVASSPDGGVCTFIPDPLGGYGSSCASQADLRAGGSITVLGGAGELEHEMIAVLVVPDGGPTPTVTAAGGAQEAEPVPGIGAVLVPEESRVRIGGVSLLVPESDTP